MLAMLTALAEPNRLRIVELLREGPQPVAEIGERLQLRQPQVSKHLRVLKDAGLVTARPLAQQRLYELRALPFRELHEWLDEYRGLWDTRFDELDHVITDLKRKTEKGKRRHDPRPK